VSIKHAVAIFATITAHCVRISYLKPIADATTVTKRIIPHGKCGRYLEIEHLAITPTQANVSHAIS
jgi:hypothetical protein